MPFQPSRRLPAAAVSVLAAGLMLTVASCAGQITPLGPGAQPALHRLRSPIVLQAMSVQPQPPAGRCPAGSAALRASPGQCYRKLGTPVTFTSAAVAISTLTPAQPSTPSEQAAGPSSYGFLVALPVSDAAALTAVTTTAADAHGCLAISVAGWTWALPTVLRPFTRPQFQIILPSKQAHQFERLLGTPG